MSLQSKLLPGILVVFSFINFPILVERANSEIDSNELKPNIDVTWTSNNSDVLSIKTENAYPTPATTWEFKKGPFSLSQIIVNDTKEKLLARPGGVSFFDGQVQKYMSSQAENVTAKTNKIIVTKKFSNGLESLETLENRAGVLYWNIEMNAREKEVWVELDLVLPIDAKKLENYFDGHDVFSSSNQNIWHKQLMQTFPVSFQFSKDIGLAFGITPYDSTSILQNGIKDNKSFYLTRLIVTPEHPVKFEYILYTSRTGFDYHDAMQRYQDSFPEVFKPNPNVDPRMTDGRRVDALQTNHGSGGPKNAADVSSIMGSYGGVEWAYAITKRGGDLYGHEDSWDFEELPAFKIKMAQWIKDSDGLLDFNDLKKYHEGRKIMWEKADYRTNVAMSYFCIPYIEKGLVKKYDLMKYTYPENDDVSALRSSWGFEFNSGEYHFYPWANKYEEILRRDIPLLAKEISIPSIGHDLFTEWPTAPLYRGPVDHYMEGWSFDSKGKCLSSLLGLRETGRFIHTVTNSNGHTVGLFSNGIDAVTPITMSVPDIWMTEATDLHSLTSGKSLDSESHHMEGRENFKLIRNFAGAKMIYQHTYHSSNLGDVISWQKLDASKITEIVDDFYKDMVTFYYQTGILPAWPLISSVDAIYDEVPYIFDVLSRGWSPSPVISGDIRLERARYGQGLQSAVVITNREANAVRSKEAIINNYLGDYYAIPMNLKGQPQTFKFADGLTKFDMNIEPMGNKIFTLNAAIKLNGNIHIAGKSETYISPISKNYKLSLESDKDANVGLIVTPDPRFAVAKIVCNDSVVAGNNIKLKKGENTIEIKTESTEYLSTIEAYTAFPFNKSGLVIEGTSSKRLEATCQNLQDLFSVRLKTIPQILKKQDANQAVIVIGTKSELKKTGVWVDGNKLCISGENDFDTQQRAWLFMRLLERKDKRFAVERRGHPGGSPQTKLMFEKADLLNKQVPILNRQGKQRCNWTDYLRSKTKEDLLKGNDMLRDATIIPEIKLPQQEILPVLDGKLDEAVWEKANKITSFHFIRNTADSKIKPTQSTEAKFYITGDYLVIGMKCYEKNMSEASAFSNIKERDGAVWHDDCVEIRVAPGIERNASRYLYYGFLFNQLGVCFDMCVDPDGGTENTWKKWNSDAKAVIYKDKEYWSIEVLIPLKDMNGALTAKKWRFQISRQEQLNHEYSIAVPMPDAEEITEQMFYPAWKVSN